MAARMAKIGRIYKARKATAIERLLALKDIEMLNFFYQLSHETAQRGSVARLLDFCCLMTTTLTRFFRFLRTYKSHKSRSMSL